MSETIHTLSSYIIPLLARRFERDPHTPLRPSFEERAAAVLFVDISGFTALTEHLAERGAAGAEDLSHALNAYFGPLIELISAHGGQVIDFAGDAVIAAWFAEAGADDLPVLARRAAACALQLRDRLNDSEVAPEVRIGMKAGLSAGRVWCCNLGGADGRWRFVLAGDPVREMSAAERQAARGEVVAAPAARVLLAGHVHARQTPGGHARLDGVPDGLPARALDNVSLSPESEAALRAYVPRPVLANLDAGHSGWLAELRTVSVLFANLTLDERAADFPARAQAVMHAVTAVVARLGGVLNQFVVDDKGTTLVAGWGLPGWTHEDNAARAVHAGGALQTELAALHIDTAVGLATGRVFCGERGNSRRREYAMIGKTVNLAARLMQAASGVVLCDQATSEAAHGRGHEPRPRFQALPPFQLKGSPEPVTVYRIRAADASGPSKSLSTLVGREPEQATLHACLEGFARGVPAAARVVVIEGEPGIGKSRLVDDLRVHATGCGLVCFRGNGSAVESATPYHAWRPVFHGLLSDDVAADDIDERRRVVGQRLERFDARSRDLMPLLNPVLSLEFPETELTRQMQGEARADSTNRLLGRVLADYPAPADAGEPRRRVVFLEDAHWFDSSSWSLVREVMCAAPAVLLVLSTRPAGEAAAKEHRELSQSPQALWIRPAPLGSSHTAAVLRERLGVPTIAPEVVELVHARAGGNPFFIEELAHALRESGLLVVERGVCGIVGDRGDVGKLIPDSVHGTVAARIDQLSLPLQLTLKVASVIGRVFSVRLLTDIYPVVADRAKLAPALETLERLEFTRVDAGAPEPGYVFKHAITQQVAYDLLLFAQRRDLHRAVAEWYERTHAERLEPVYPILAYHWKQAEVAPKAIEYLDRAGETAVAADANDEALRLLGEAEALDGSAPPAVSAASSMWRRARRAERMAQARYRLGALGDSEALCRQTLAMLGQPVPAAGARLATRSLALLGDQLRRRVAPRARGVDGTHREAALLSYRAHMLLTFIAFVNSNTTLTLYGTLNCLKMAEVIGPSPELANAYALICGGAGLMPLHPLARAYQRRALATMRGLGGGDSLAWAMVLSRISVYTCGAGKSVETRRHLDRAMQIFARLGEWSEWGLCAQMLGRCVVHEGDFAALAAVADELEQSARRRGARLELAWSLNNRAESLLFLSNDLSTVVDLCARAVDLVAGTTHSSSVCIAEGVRALAEMRAGDPRAARASAQRALAIMRSIQPTSFGMLVAYGSTAWTLLECWETAAPHADRELRQEVALACKQLGRLAQVFPVAEPRARLCEGLRLWLLGKRRRAERRWHAALRRATELGMRYEIGAAHLELGRHGVSAAAAHLGAAAAIFAELGAEHDRRAALAAGVAVPACAAPVPGQGVA